MSLFAIDGDHTSFSICHSDSVKNINYYLSIKQKKEIYFIIPLENLNKLCSITLPPT